MTNRSALSNRILASIPHSEYRRLSRQLEPVTLKFGQVLYEPGKAIRYVYFPVDCLVSLLTAVDRQRTLEVGMVGNEGMAGMPFILGVGISGVRALVQGEGQALRMGAAPFRMRVRSESRPAAGAVPLHLRADGTDLPDRSLQPLSRCRGAAGALAADDPRSRRRR